MATNLPPSDLSGGADEQIGLSLFAKVVGLRPVQPRRSTTRLLMPFSDSKFDPLERDGLWWNQ